jgi:hypothetical protein
MKNTQTNRDITGTNFQHDSSGYVPIFAHNGIVLAEVRTPKCYSYFALNPQTGEKKHLFHTKSRLPEDKYAEAAENLKNCGLSSEAQTNIVKLGIEQFYGNKGKAEQARSPIMLCESGDDVERPLPSNVIPLPQRSAKFIVSPKETAATTKPLNEYEHMSTELDRIFRNTMPEFGFNVREQQVELAHHMLKALYNRKISLSEAGVGIGKTFAYIIAAVLVKYQKKDDFWIRSSYGFSKNFTESTPMPIVISTSSIALQNAIAIKYIPQISKILMDSGIIEHSLTSVIRKGKDHYVCDYRLNSFMTNCHAEDMPVVNELLSNAYTCIDLDEYPALSRFARQRICVHGNCGCSCRYYNDCRCIKLLGLQMDNRFDFQICNHNYYLADLFKRNNKQRPLIPHYQALIIDEAHKFLPAAHQMYATTVSYKEIRGYESVLKSVSYGDKVLNMLPDYPVTDRIEDVETFLKFQKQTEYYLDKKAIECPA